MCFELTEALLDGILFSMEDQNGLFFVDTQEEVVVSEDELELGALDADEENRYIDLPEWDSSEGFRLMERFAAGFRNPVIRKQLTAALDRGKGVFRAFKDTLSEHPESEQLWYSFKEQEMKKAIYRWYNALREEWGLELIGAEPEETESLVMEDFRFRAPLPADAAAAEELHRQCLGDYPGQDVDRPWVFPGDFALIAETASGEFAGYVSAEILGATLRVAALEIKAEYRGLGLGEALLTRLLELPGQEKLTQILIDLPQDAEGFSRVLLRESFVPYGVRFFKKLQKNP
jgi:ribosomal protein S18 acetylase RimI-like enzyme